MSACSHAGANESLSPACIAIQRFHAGVPLLSTGASECLAGVGIREKVHSQLPKGFVRLPLLALGGFKSSLHTQDRSAREGVRLGAASPRYIAPARPKTRGRSFAATEGRPRTSLLLISSRSRADSRACCSRVKRSSMAISSPARVASLCAAVLSARLCKGCVARGTKASRAMWVVRPANKTK